MKLHVDATKFVIEPETNAEEDFLWELAKNKKRIKVVEVITLPTIEEQLKESLGDLSER